MHSAGGPWDGARNLADLGGLPLVDGGQTRHGVIWRSAATEWLTADGWRAAGDAGLRRIVDLRNDVERVRRPEHPVVDEALVAGIEVVAAPTEDPEDPVFLAECGPWLDHPGSWTPNMARYPQKFARVFTAIADAKGPVLVHCAGGRGFRGAAAHRGHAMAYSAATGGWALGQLDHEWTARELDQAVAQRIPVLLQWVESTNVTEYLQRAGVDEQRLYRLRHLLRP